MMIPEKTFADISFMTVDTLLQLPPIRGKLIFSCVTCMACRACIVNYPPFYHQSPALQSNGFQFHDMMHYKCAQNTRSFSSNDSGNQSPNTNCNSDDDFGAFFRNTVNN